MVGERIKKEAFAVRDARRTKWGTVKLIPTFALPGLTVFSSAGVNQGSHETFSTSSN